MNEFFEKFDVVSRDFAAAGEASANIKRTLKKIGVNSLIVRRIAIAAYEAELNMIIHSEGGVMSLEITPESVTLRCDDTGPGIPDISLAMTEGYSTAPDSVRMMGFGAGMGLPNIKKNADDFSIKSDKSGTSLKMVFHIS